MAKPINNIGINSLLSSFKFTGFSSVNKYRMEMKLPKGFPDNTVIIPNNQENLLAILGNEFVSSNFGGMSATNTNSSQSGIITIENNINTNNIISLFCIQTTMPSRSLMTLDHKQFSAPYRVPYSQQQYDPVTLTFLTNSDFDTRTYFETWMGSVCNIGSNTMNYYDEYVSDIRIIPINSDGTDSNYYVDLYEAYPMTIGEVSMGYDDNDFAKITVTFSYRWWQSSTDNTSIMRTRT